MTIFNHIIYLHRPFEEFSDRGFVEKGHAEDAKHIKSASIKPEVMLNDSHKAIGCNCRENLDSYRIFGYAPKRLYMQMLLDPLKKQFDLPSIFIKQRNMPRADFKIISKVSESSLVFGRVIADTPEQNRVFPSCLLSRKPYCLVVENVIRAFKKIFSLNDFILKLAPFPYYKVGSDATNSKKPCEVKVSPVKNIICIRLVRNLIHGIHVMNFGFSNVNKGRNLGNNVIEGMYLDTTFCLSKTCPPEEIQTQINRCGVESIESTCNFKFFSNTFPLSDRYHLVCKFLKDITGSLRICLGKIATRYHGLAKAEMIRLLAMCGYYTYKFSKAFTAGQLSIHHNQQLISATERFYVFVTLVFHNDAIKDSLWKKLNELTENIFSLVHDTRFYKSDTILLFQIDTLNFKSYIFNFHSLTAEFKFF